MVSESTTEDIIGFSRQKSNSAGNIFPKYPCFLGDFHVRPLDIYPVATFPTHHACPVRSNGPGGVSLPSGQPSPATARVAKQGPRPTPARRLATSKWANPDGQARAGYV